MVLHFNPLITPATSRISTTELRGLLISLQEKSFDVNIRYRIIGEMWQAVFMGVLEVTSTGVFLQDKLSRKIVFIPDLKLIIQFELDSPLSTFHPHFHYDVVLFQSHARHH